MNPQVNQNIKTQRVTHPATPRMADASPAVLSDQVDRPVRTVRVDEAATTVVDFVLDNSAVRITAVLESVRGTADNISAVDGWANALGVPEGGDLFSAFAEFRQQVELTRAQVNALPESETATMQHYKQQISETTVYSLRACAEALRRHLARERVFTAETTSVLIELVRELVDEVGRTDELPAEFRLAITQRLHEVEAALLTVQITGINGVVQLWAKLPTWAGGVTALTTDPTETSANVGGLPTWRATHVCSGQDCGSGGI